MKRPVEDRHFSTHDSVSLFYRRWPVESGTPRGAILLFHRGHEHSGRIGHLVDELDLPDFEFYAWDARGHGQSPGERGYSPSFATSVRDVQTFLDHLGAEHGVDPERTAVIAQSVGAVIVSTWAHDYAPKVRALVLASPAFEVRLYVPFARPGLALMHKLRGKFFVQSYVKSQLLTHDLARRASFDADPLITRAISVNILLEMHEAARRVVRDARAITIPTQLLISGADFVVNQQPQHEFFVNLGTPDGTDIWVDPAHGDDHRDGTTRTTALRTVGAAWGRVPAGSALTTGYRIRLAAGHYPSASLVNYWEDRHGTADAPIIVEAADGAHTAVFDGDINMFQVSHFALIGVDIDPQRLGGGYSRFAARLGTNDNQRFHDR